MSIFSFKKLLQVYRIFVRSLESMGNNLEMRPHNEFWPADDMRTVWKLADRDGRSPLVGWWSHCCYSITREMDTDWIDGLNPIIFLFDIKPEV